MPSHPDLPDSILPEGADGDQHYTQAGNGPAVLLIHGSLCDYRYWRWQIPAFAQTHRVLAPSLHGCWPAAGCHPQPGYAIAHHVADLHRFVRRLVGSPGVHVIGHSRGAQVALEFAHAAPELCRSLTLADPGFRFSDEPETPVFYAPALAQLEDGDIDGALEQFIDTVNGAQTWHKMVYWFKDMVRDNALTLLSQVREANLAVALEVPPALRCPVLLVGGTQSPQKYVTRLDRLQQMVPAARRVRIALAAHGMNLANPRAFNREILAFLAAVGRTENASEGIGNTAAGVGHADVNVPSADDPSGDAASCPASPLRA